MADIETIHTDKTPPANVFHLAMDRFAGLNAIHAEYFSDHRPARAAIQVS